MTLVPRLEREETRQIRKAIEMSHRSKKNAKESSTIRLGISQRKREKAPRQAHHEEEKWTKRKKERKKAEEALIVETDGVDQTESRVIRTFGESFDPKKTNK